MMSTRTASAIMFPLSCLQYNPGEFPRPSSNNRGLSPLQDVPTEILTTIFTHLTLTSRVNLALTCKLFANLLTNTPKILTFPLSNQTPGGTSAREFELLTDDESFRCYTLVNSMDDPLELPRMPYEYVCECCCERVPRGNRRYLYKHNRAYACAGGRSRMFTVGMFQLMEWGWMLRARERTRRLLLATEEETSGKDDDDQNDDYQCESSMGVGNEAGLEDRMEDGSQLKDESEAESEEGEID